MKRVENVLLFLLFALLPSQLTYHWWPKWSLVNGIRVDYLSPALYFTDILLLSVLLIKHKTLLKYKKLFFVLSLVALVNILISVLPEVSLYKWMRIIFLFSFAVVLFENFIQHKKIIVRGLMVAIVWTSLLALAQASNQGSLGGVFYWLGERSFNVTTPGIAKVPAGNLGTLVRPYATLPHPNALAGWLLLALIVVIGNTVKVNKKVLFVSAASLSGILFSMSRASLVAATLGVSIISKLPSWLKALSIGMGIFIALLVVPGNPESLSDRKVLLNSSLNRIVQSPILGRGLGTAVIGTPVLNQPVHNIFVLVLEELGILFGLLGVWILRIVLRSGNKFILAGMAVVVITGLVDHYLITLWQNALMLTVFMAWVAVELADGRTADLL